MLVFDVVIALLLVGAALAAIARRVGAPIRQLDWTEMGWAQVVGNGEDEET